MNFKISSEIASLISSNILKTLFLSSSLSLAFNNTGAFGIRDQFLGEISKRFYSSLTLFVALFSFELLFNMFFLATAFLIILLAGYIRIFYLGGVALILGFYGVVGVIRIFFSTLALYSSVITGLFLFLFRTAIVTTPVANIFYSNYVKNGNILLKHLFRLFAGTSIIAFFPTHFLFYIIEINSISICKRNLIKTLDTALPQNLEDCFMNVQKISDFATFAIFTDTQPSFKWAVLVFSISTLSIIILSVLAFSRFFNPEISAMKNSSSDMKRETNGKDSFKESLSTFFIKAHGNDYSSLRITK